MKPPTGSLLRLGLTGLFFIALSPAARAAFTPLPLPVVGDEVSLVPTHPSLQERGYLAFLVQEADGSNCEVGWVRIGDGAVEEEVRRACRREDGFYNLLPAAPGAEEGAAMLVAVTPTGVSRVAPGEPRELVSAPTLVAVSPDLKFAGPLLWEDPGTEEDALRLVVPELGAVSIWERPPGAVPFSLVERYPVEVRARFDARLGRDTLHPDYHLLANLRMPKFALGGIGAQRPRGLAMGIENRIRLVGPTGGESARTRAFDLDLFEGEDGGLKVVRGNRLGDFDGDGQIDVMVVAARGGLTNLESRAEVYFGPLESSLEGPPAVRYRLTDAAAGTELIDVDRDGARELYRPTVEISIGAVVRILLFQEVKIEYFFAELEAGDPEEPTWFCSIPRSFTVNLSGVAHHPGPLFDLRGDFDGDGVTDVVTGTPEDGYELLFGENKSEGRWCTSDRSEVVELPGLETLTVSRFDGGARSDLIAWTRSAQGRARLVLLLAR